MTDMRQPYVLHEVPGPVDTTVSIIVPCLNHIDMTALSLRSLMSYTDMPFELIVVNDGSTDNTAAALGELAQSVNKGGTIVSRMRVINNPIRQGCSSATNLGVAAATGQVLVWCNNDMLYGPNWLSPLVRIIVSHNDLGIVGPWPVTVSAPFRTDPVPEFAALAARLVNPQDPALYSSSAPWVFRRDLLPHVGGYLLDPHYNPAYFEDWDLYNRLLTAGYHFGLTRRSFFFHYVGTTCSHLPEVAARFYRNRTQFLTRWPGGGPFPGYLGVAPQQLGLA